jgi:hypothetical protein
MEKRTSAAKAGPGSVIYGTAEAVPFQETQFLTQIPRPRNIFTRSSRGFESPVPQTEVNVCAL